MTKERIIDVIAFLFILLFMYTAVSKLLRIEYFKAVIVQTPELIPYAVLIQWGVPLAEIIISVTLAVSRFRLIALYGSLVLMLVFTGYIGWILGFSQQLPCACGGVIEKMGWRAHLLFNSAFSLLALIAIWLEKKTRKSKLDSAIGPTAYS